MAETVAESWSRCLPWIEAALECAGGGFLAEDVQAAVVAGDAQFWPGSKCAMVTEIMTSPRVKVLNFWLLGGDLRELLAMRPHIERWAKVNGCARAIGGGVADKRGWSRVLASSGYRPRWTIYSKELTE